MPFIRGIGLTRYIIRTVGARGIKKHVMTLAYAGSDLQKLILHLIKYGTKIRNELVYECELQFIISSLISPLFWWRESLVRRRW
jgi:hypothetical protein